MAHGGEDATRQAAIVGGLGKAERLDEVALCQAMMAGVVAHPRGQEGAFGDGSEQRAAYLLGRASIQQLANVGVQVLHERAAAVPAPEPVVHVHEHVDGGPDCLDVGHADLSPLAGLGEYHSWWGDKPSERRGMPGAEIGSGS
ncbi:hypothetical protein ACU686_29735 [Yinghuangia aomiensis]